MTAEAALRPIRNARSRRPRSRWARWYRRNERSVLGWIGLIGFFLTWQIGADLGIIDKFFFSSPVDIINVATVEVFHPKFWSDFRVSAVELLGGAVVAMGLGIPVGIATGWYTRVGYMFDPWLNFFNSLPRISLLPIVILWFGLGYEAKLVVVFLGAFFAIVIPTNQGVRTVDRSLLDVAKSFGASQRRVFTSVVLPATVPFMVSGLRLAVGRSLIGVIISELYAQTEGLGVMIGKAQANMQADKMLFAVMIFTLSGILATEALRRLERRFQRWRPGLDQEENESES